MATLITPDVIAREALATLYNTIVLAALVSRDYDGDFRGKQGDTITVRTPAVFEVDEFDRAQGIQLQDPAEGSFTVTLDTIPDVSFPVTAEELTLEIDNFNERLLTPAMEAIAQYLDGKLAVAIADAASEVLSPRTDHEARDAILQSRVALSRAKAPLTQRYGVLSPEATGEILDDDFLQGVNTSGDPEALRDGTVGRLYGHTLYETQTLGYGPGTAGETDGVTFHRSAVALVSRQLDRPMGLSDSQVSLRDYRGLGLRIVYDYDNDKKQDVISVDFLFGVEAVRPEFAFELDYGIGS